jgi:FkbM family methyltransferase
VGAPSATLFRREEGFRFDPALKWLVDVDAYIRILKSHGSFAYTPEPLINITTSAPHQVTCEIQADPVIQFLENAYLYRSLNFGLPERLRYWPVFMRLARGLNTDSLAVVSSDPKAKDCPLEVRASLMLQKLRLALKRTLANGVARLSRRKRPDERERTSYSQCGEDLIIDFIFMWLGRKEVSYLDIGANDSSWLNNTYFFYLKGYRGVLIEPDEHLCKLLSARRPRDRCLNVAVGVDGKPSAKMYVMTSRTLNTLISSQATEYEGYGREKVERIVEVPQREINEILNREFDRTPNLVSLDVEGLDFEILKKWDFTRFRPEVFCVETLTFTQNGTERKLTDIVDFMKGRGYFTYADTYINTIFVSNEAWSSRCGTG